MQEPVDAVARIRQEIEQLEGQRAAPVAELRIIDHEISLLRSLLLPPSGRTISTTSSPTFTNARVEARFTSAVHSGRCRVRGTMADLRRRTEQVIAILLDARDGTLRQIEIINEMKAHEPDFNRNMLITILKHDSRLTTGYAGRVTLQESAVAVVPGELLTTPADPPSGP